MCRESEGLPPVAFTLAVKVECEVMVAKGHNHGLCRKCGRNHVHGMKGKHHSEESKRKISKANKGKKRSLEYRRRCSETRKGKKLSPEHYAKVVKANKSPEKIARISQKLKGRVSPMKGYRYTPLQRIKKSFAMRNSEKFHEAIRRRDEEKVKEFLRSLYGIPEEVVFFPASKYDHKFARFVLIEGKHSFGFVHCRLLEQFPNENAVMVRK